MVMRTERVAEYELGLLFRNKVFQRVLGPGRYRLARLGNLPEVVKLDLRRMPVREPALAALRLTRPALVDEYFVVASMADNQVGLVFADGKLVDLVGPGEEAFYAKRLRQIALRVLDPVNEIEVPAELVAPLARLDGRGLVLSAEVVSGHVGLLYLDGVLERQLEPGRYAFLRAARRVEVVNLDLRLQTLEVTGQEILTKDRIAIRANVTAVYRLADPVKAVSVTANLRDYFYKELQFAVR